MFYFVARVFGKESIGIFAICFSARSLPRKHTWVPSSKLIRIIIMSLIPLKDFMISTLLINLKSFLSYAITNLSCLFYGPQFFVSKSLILNAYTDLLVDFSETFGMWVVLVSLIFSAMIVVVVIQQVSVLGWHHYQTSRSTKYLNERTSLTIIYRSILMCKKFFSLK